MTNAESPISYLSIEAAVRDPSIQEAVMVTTETPADNSRNRLLVALGILEARAEHYGLSVEEMDVVVARLIPAELEDE